MSNFEIVLTVLACAVPLVALLFVLPKFKKKEKAKVETPTKTYEEIKKEETPKEETKLEEKKENKSLPKITNTEFDSNDFKSYLKRKQQTTSKPMRVDLPEDFEYKTMPYLPRRRRREDLKPKTVAEEIRSLSPELKALIFTGALDKKNFD